MDAEMDSVITNTGVSGSTLMKQEFVSTQRNLQKLVYRGRCYTLKQTNRSTRGYTCKLCTNLDATQVIRTGEHAEGCGVDAHAFYHQQQLNELKRLVAGHSRRYMKFSMSWQAMPPPAKQLPRIFQRGCRPVTQCITAVRRDTHDFHLNNVYYACM
ncbi:hypothetical protein T03_3878 [Trichinella britovi]|uniref:FLYWCH-type domain-containing protein n=1 Tax=Trichinella britovi TaxID=45882 RepID=A0A0V1C8R4_TRIBR|nr:hypothetical protein T03_3878 [Trichinella britovi]